MLVLVLRLVRVLLLLLLSLLLLLLLLLSLLLLLRAPSLMAKSGDTPASTSLVSRLSTAVCVYETSSTRPPLATSARTANDRAVVFPVPGRPRIKQ